MPFSSGRHRSSALACGEADDAALRRRRQMACKNAVGMSGGDRRIENCAQERALVGHRFSGVVLKSLCRLSIPLQQKKTPATSCGGSVCKQILSAADVSADHIAEQIPLLALELHELKLADRCIVSRAGVNLDAG